MFSEAYIIFSLWLTKPLQKALFPSCFASHADCSTELTHVQNYIQLCGIIVGECPWHWPTYTCLLKRWCQVHLHTQTIANT